MIEGAVMDIVVWQRSLGLEEYEEAFRDNKIDERVLPKSEGNRRQGDRRVQLRDICATECKKSDLPLGATLQSIAFFFG